MCLRQRIGSTLMVSRVCTLCEPVGCLWCAAACVSAELCCRCCCCCRCRQEAKEVEAEYQRVEAEGPASHRKKDMLDKATKEAEHRERLQDLLSRLTSLNERVVLEESSRQKWAQRAVEAGFREQ